MLSNCEMTPLTDVVNFFLWFSIRAIRDRPN